MELFPETFFAPEVERSQYSEACAEFSNVFFQFALTRTGFSVYLLGRLGMIDYNASKVIEGPTASWGPLGPIIVALVRQWLVMEPYISQLPRIEACLLVTQWRFWQMVVLSIFIGLVVMRLRFVLAINIRNMARSSRDMVAAVRNAILRQGDLHIAETNRRVTEELIYAYGRVEIVAAAHTVLAQADEEGRLAELEASSVVDIDGADASADVLDDDNAFAEAIERADDE